MNRSTISRARTRSITIALVIGTVAALLGTDVGAAAARPTKPGNRRHRPPVTHSLVLRSLDGSGNNRAKRLLGVRLTLYLRAMLELTLN